MGAGEAGGLSGTTCRPAVNWFCPGGPTPPQRPRPRRRGPAGCRTVSSHTLATPRPGPWGERLHKGLYTEEEGAERALVPYGRPGPFCLAPFPNLGAQGPSSLQCSGTWAPVRLGRYPRNASEVPRVCAALSGLMLFAF